jgi:hypothetical protein
MKNFRKHIVKSITLIWCYMLGFIFNVNAQTVSIQASAISTSVCYGASVTFTASTSSISSPTYQWVYNNVTVPGATNSTYTRTTNITDVVSVIVNGTYSKTIYLSDYYACGLDRQGRQIPTSSDTLVSQNGWINQGTGLNDKGRKFSYKINVITDGLILNVDSRNINSYRPVVPGTWYDLTTNHYNGTVYGNVNYGSDNGGAINFAGGDNDYIQFPAGVYFNGSSFTIQAWVYPVELTRNWNRIIDFGNGSDNYDVVYAFSQGTTGHPGFRIVTSSSGGGADLGANDNLTANAWNFVAVTFERNSGSYDGTVRFYLNGQASGTVSNYGAPPNVTRNNCYMGKSNWGNPPDPNCKGGIGSLQIYNTCLTAAQVLQNYNNTKDFYGR